MADKVPSIRLNSGYDMPLLGLGTYNNRKSNSFEVKDAVKIAVQMGYRHFDTAWYYQTEREIGDAIKELIQDGKVKREDLFICTKLGFTYNEPDQVEPACRASLEALGINYIDLYLIHFPIAFADATLTETTPTDYLDTWKAMEKLVDKGLVRSLGVSNFNIKQVERILDMEGLKYKPSNNQVEITPFLASEDLLQFLSKQGITLTGYGTFGAPGQNYHKVKPEDGPKFLENPVIVEIGKKYGKTAAQVILRWGIQRRVAVIPKSTNQARLAENFDIFDFELEKDDMKKMMSLDKGKRLNVERFYKWKDHPYYPFEK